MFLVEIAKAVVGIIGEIIGVLDGYFSAIAAQCSAYCFRYRFEPNESDEAIAVNLAESLNDAFPEGIVETLRDMNEEERLETFTLLAEKLALSFRLGTDVLEKIQIVEFAENDDRIHYSKYKTETHCIQMNKNMLLYDLYSMEADENVTDMVLYDCVRMLIHELRHAYQYQAVLKNINCQDYSGYDIKGRVALWTKNYSEYIGSKESLRAYMDQSIEIDARGYADYVLGKHEEGFR